MKSAYVRPLTRVPLTVWVRSSGIGVDPDADDDDDDGAGVSDGFTGTMAG